MGTKRLNNTNPSVSVSSPVPIAFRSLKSENSTYAASKILSCHHQSLAKFSFGIEPYTKPCNAHWSLFMLNCCNWLAMNQGLRRDFRLGISQSWYISQQFRLQGSHLVDRCLGGFLHVKGNLTEKRLIDKLNYLIKSREKSEDPDSFGSVSLLI